MNIAWAFTVAATVIAAAILAITLIAGFARGRRHHTDSPIRHQKGNRS